MVPGVVFGVIFHVAMAGISVAVCVLRGSELVRVGVVALSALAVVHGVAVVGIFLRAAWGRFFSIAIFSIYALIAGLTARVSFLGSDSVWIAGFETGFFLLTLALALSFGFGRRVGGHFGRLPAAGAGAEPEQVA